MSNTKDKNRSRSALSSFFLSTAVCWGLLWIIYVLSGIPIVMLTKSVAYDPANMTSAQSFLLDAGSFLHTALRWLFPVSLPVVWLVFHMTAKPAGGTEKKLLGKAGVVSILTGVALLLILTIAHAALPIDQLRTGSGLGNNPLIRLHAVLTASPVGIAALVYALFARNCGKELGNERLHSFGKGAMIANGAMLAVTLVAAFATVIKGTWMSIDWIVILPLAASVIYEFARASKELTVNNDGE